MGGPVSGAARKLELVHGGEIVVGMPVLDVTDPLQDSVEEGQLNVRTFRDLPREFQILKGQPYGEARRILMALHLAELLDPVGGAKRSAIEKRHEPLVLELDQ